MTLTRNSVQYFSDKSMTLLLLGSVLTLNVNAQTPTSNVIEEVVVTATKKKNVEVLVDVPLAVSAFNAAQLDALKVRDLTSLNFSIPNTSLQEIGTTKGGANFTIRGLGINSSIPSIEPTVGIFVDGVYTGLNGSAIFDTFDLESVEVLRGPQGVLFGRNVTGGAVVVNTSDPSFEPVTKFKVAAESGFRGTGANYYIQGSTTGTLIEDTLAGKIAVYYNDDKGWFENTLIDGSTSDFGASDTFIIRPAITWTPSDSISITAKYEYGEFSGDGPAAQTNTNGSGVDGQIVNFDTDTFDFSVNEGTFNDSEWQSLSIETNIDISFGDGQITNIFGYRDFSNDTLIDFDATPVRLFDGSVITDHDQTSNELRFNGQFGKWNVTTGLFYFEQNIAYAETRVLLADFANLSPIFPLVLTGGGIQDQQTIGVFAQTEYQVNDRLTLSAGVRYSNEEKEAQIAPILFGAQPNTDCRVTSGDCVFAFSEDTIPGDATFRTNNLSPHFGAEYALTDNSNIYTSWNRSFRAGGFNLRNTSGNIDDLIAFDDEEVEAFEIGWKFQSANRSTLNVSLFLTKIDDLQREVNTASVVNVVDQNIRNVGNAEIRGLEIDGKLIINERLSLTGSFGYLDGEYTDVSFDINNDGFINQADLDLEIPRLTDNSFNIGLLYNKRLAGLGHADFQINYGRKSETPFTDDNLGVVGKTKRLDANLTLTRDNGLVISLYGKNLSNEVLFTGSAQLPDNLLGVPLGGTFSPLTKGRVIGLELQHQF